VTVPVWTVVAQGVWMVVLWVVLWGEVTVANVVSGVAVSAVLLLLLPLRRGARGRFYVRPLRAVGFVLWLLVQIVRSNLLVAWEILTPRDRIRAGVVSVVLPPCSDGLVTLVANCITLTPGTLTLEVRREPTTLYVHVLHLRDIDDVRHDVLDLLRRVVRAFGSPEAIARVEADIRREVAA
jgi:multicomponent Na+:H+ antiporter subunit E